MKSHICTTRFTSVQLIGFLDTSYQFFVSPSGNGAGLGVTPWWTKWMNTGQADIAPAQETAGMSPFGLGLGVLDLGWDPMNGRHMTTKPSSFPKLFAGGGVLAPINVFDGFGNSYIGNTGLRWDEFYNTYGWEPRPVDEISKDDPNYEGIMEHTEQIRDKYPNPKYIVDKQTGFYVPMSEYNQALEQYKTNYDPYGLGSDSGTYLQELVVTPGKGYEALKKAIPDDKVRQGIITMLQHYRDLYNKNMNSSTGSSYPQMYDEDTIYGNTADVWKMYGSPKIKKNPAEKIDWLPWYNPRWSSSATWALPFPKIAHAFGYDVVLDPDLWDNPLLRGQHAFEELSHMGQEKKGYNSLNVWNFNWNMDRDVIPRSGNNAYFTNGSYEEQGHNIMYPFVMSHITGAPPIFFTENHGNYRKFLSNPWYVQNKHNWYSSPVASVDDLDTRIREASKSASDYGVTQYMDWKLGSGSADYHDAPWYTYLEDGVWKYWQLNHPESNGAITIR